MVAQSNRSKRVAIYCRVSTASQEDGSSLETQEVACRAFVAEHGWNVIDMYREVFTGAELFDRPQLGRLREAIRRREVDVVVAQAIERLVAVERGDHLVAVFSQGEREQLLKRLLVVHEEDAGCELGHGQGAVGRAFLRL